MIHDICDILKMLYGTCQQNLSQELNIQHIAVKSLPRLLGNDQKEHRVTICFELNEQTESDPSFIAIIIIGDDSWVYRYSKDEGAIISVKDTKFTVIQESTSLKQCQINVDLFF